MRLFSQGMSSIPIMVPNAAPVPHYASSRYKYVCRVKSGPVSTRNAFVVFSELPPSEFKTTHPVVAVVGVYPPV